MMESGPASGAMASAEVGRRLGYRDLIAFDMGGTTAKSALIKGGAPEITQGYYIGGYANGHPVTMPVVDIVEVGAGGGSIAWIDEVGALKVGPRSASADPDRVLLPRRDRTHRHRRQRRTRTHRHRRFLGGDMVLDSTQRATRSHTGSPSPSDSEPSRPPSGSCGSRPPRCRSRCARCRSSAGMIHVVSR